MSTIPVRVERYYIPPISSWFRGGGYMTTEYYLEWVKDTNTVERFDVDSDTMVTCIMCQKSIGRVYEGVVVERLVSGYEE